MIGASLEGSLGSERLSAASNFEALSGFSLEDISIEKHPSLSGKEKST